jgi:hypothetical protein
MVMLTNELADITPASPRQKFRIQRALEQHEVSERFAHNVCERIATGELSKQEALQAIRKIESSPRKATS